MAAKRKIHIFDTTLRDGEQSPGASLTPDEKLKVADLSERWSKLDQAAKDAFKPAAE